LALLYGIAAGSGSAAARDGSAPPLAAVLAAHVPIDDPVAEELHIQLANGTRTGTFEHKRHYAALLAFYGQRDWRPLWTANGEVTPAGRRIINHLRHADEDGLDPAAYPVSARGFDDLVQDTPEAVVEIELTLAESALEYAEHAQAGRVAPQKISGYFKQVPARPDPIEVLRRLARTNTPERVLAAYNPPHEGYRRLRAKLAELRQRDTAGAAEPTVPVPAGPTIRFGDSDDRVPVLRARLKTEAPTDPGDDVFFDDALAEAVMDFQRRNNLRPDGIVGPRTIAVLNGEVDRDPIADIIANMERWRWVPRDFGAFHVYVNIPEFVVRVQRAGRTVHSTRIVVGTTKNQTPIFSDEMEHIIVNPYWNVPLSIARKEMLPSIQANPGGYFARHNYEVVYNGRVVSPYSVEWSAANLRNIRIRQRPGARNALGRIKFMFPNQHSIYLHDTPSKSLFERDVRAFSHGCVRVHNPLEFADAVLVGSSWNSDRVKKILGGNERRIDLPSHIPVHLTYFTSVVNGRGELENHPDIYGHHRKLRAALGL